MIYSLKNEIPSTDSYRFIYFIYLLLCHRNNLFIKIRISLVRKTEKNALQKKNINPMAQSSLGSIYPFKFTFRLAELELDIQAKPDLNYISSAELKMVSGDCIGRKQVTAKCKSCFQSF